MHKTIRMLKELFDAEKVMTPVIKFNDRKPQFNPEGRAVNLEQTTPEEQGVNSEHILNYLKELKADSDINLHNLLILKNGKIICKTEFGNSDLNVWKMTFSACKSIVSLAIGMLVDEEKLDINIPVCNFFPEFVNPITKIKLREITVKTLLTMSSGSTFNEFFCMASDNWEKSFFKSFFAIKPGSEFAYNSLNTYILSALIKRVSGVTLGEYLKPRLFEPLEISNYYFEKSNSGVEKGGWGLYILPEDFAKIGLLVLNKGLWNGKRIISEKWISLSVAKQIDTPEEFGDFDYGFQFWTGRKANSFLFNGMFGQNMLGFFDTDVLVVCNAGNDELFQQSRFFEITDKYFANTFRSAVSKNNRAFSKLKKYNRTLKFKKQKCVFDYIFPHRKFNSFIRNFKILNNVFKIEEGKGASSGLLPKLLQIIQNNYSTGVQSVRFYSKGKILFLKYCEKSAEFDIPLGIGEYLKNEIDYYGEKYLIATSISKEQNQYIINIDFIETFSSRKIIFSQNADTFYLSQSETPGLNFFEKSLSMFKNSIAKNKFLKIVIDRLNDDFFVYKCRKIFEPTLKLNKE